MPVTPTRVLLTISAVVLLAACSSPPVADIAVESTAVATPAPTPRPTVRFAATAPPTATPAPAEDIAVANFGFSTYQGEFDDGANLNWAVLLENPSSDSFATRLSVNVSFLDGAGSVVTTANETVALLLPTKQVAITGGDSYYSNPDLATIVSMEVQIGSPDWEGMGGIAGEFTISDVATRFGEFGQVTTTAQVASTFAREIESPQAVVVYFNEAGGVIGGDYTYVDFIPAGGSIPIEISGFGSVPGIFSSDVYITLSFLSL